MAKLQRLELKTRDPSIKPNAEEDLKIKPVEDSTDNSKKNEKTSKGYYCFYLQITAIKAKTWATWILNLETLIFVHWHFWNHTGTKFVKIS